MFSKSCLNQRWQNTKCWNYVGGVFGLRLLVYHHTIVDNKVVLISKQETAPTLFVKVLSIILSNYVNQCMVLAGGEGDIQRRSRRG